MPYSRATSEAWAASVPPSVTIAAALAKRGVQAGAVASATKTSPDWKRSKSAGPRTILTRPETRPGLAGSPTIAPLGTTIVVRAASIAPLTDLRCGLGADPIVNGATSLRWPSHTARRASNQLQVGRTGFHFHSGQEEDVLRLGEVAVGLQTLTEPKCTPAYEWPGQREVARLLLTDGCVALAHLEQGLSARLSASIHSSGSTLRPSHRFCRRFLTAE